jgi:hypothetical protein
MALERSRYSAWLVVFSLGIGAAPTAGSSAGETARVGSTSPHIVAVIREATARSVTFRQLVADIERSDGIVYVEPGYCRHGVRSCRRTPWSASRDFGRFASWSIR